MIRIVTKKRLALLEADRVAAFERARRAAEAAEAESGRHADELSTITGRAKRAEAEAEDNWRLLQDKRADLAEAREALEAARAETQVLGSKLGELREQASVKGRERALLLHYGEPHTIYGSYEEALADTDTHGVHAWSRGGERPAAEAEWRVEAFTRDVESGGFRRAWKPSPEQVRGAA
ncbi:hypothetical protein [Streptomyces cavernicola]|uniref:Uncharacterized protein n=1 Tax=Streptomyces cavernicola TaxID=3043613 RepID=A0ABT6SDK1_9ACTN|nr:hypothetical protein [Streptomyces sp. B-S-A6]MDI3406049.1 hypothetical protein [Streptomyces sp. B-S-A6]